MVKQQQQCKIKQTPEWYTCSENRKTPLPIWEAKEAFRRGGGVRNLSLEDSDRITRNGINQGWWCVGSGKSNKFIWISVTEIKVQRVQFVKDWALKGFVLSKQILRYETSSSRLSKGFIVSTIAVIHLSCREPGLPGGTLFLLASDFD